MKNIILIGMPGAGKSTIGVVLAKILGYQFLDSDLLIQKQEGQILQDLIEDKGTRGFLAIENQVNRDIETETTIIATGGSAVYCHEAMMKLKEQGIVVYLQLSYENIVKRLGSLERRGVVLKKGETLLDLYRERIPLYEQYADIVVNIDDLDMNEATEKMRATISEAQKGD
jgi:shikimate kinase